MKTSVYFNHFNSTAEQRLYESLIGETVRNMGIDSFYMPRSSGSSFDLLYGDDPTKKYTQAFPIEVYVQSVDEFEGGEFFSKFGLEVKKQARFLMPKKAFDESVNRVYNRPQEGDLVWLPNFKALFEIKYVDEEYMFYTFGKNNYYGFSLICEKFRYANEPVDTGVEEIDDTVDEIAVAYEYLMSNVGATGTFLQGETVTQGTASAKVVSWNLPTAKLKLSQIKGLFVANSVVIGEESNAHWTIASTNILDDVNFGLDNNELIRQEGNAILDFSENDPYGNITR